jgi:hypothetical protein
MMTKQDSYLAIKTTYADFCKLLDGKAEPVQSKEEIAAEYEAKVDNFLAKYQRRR